MAKVLTIIRARGPVRACAVEDESAQTVLEFRPGDRWTTSWCEYDGADEPEAPHWGLATRLEVPEGASFELLVTRDYLPAGLVNCVSSSALQIGDKPGCFAWAGGRHEVGDLGRGGEEFRTLVRFEVPFGVYPVDVWVDADELEDVRRVVYLLGEPAALRDA